ncbi:MAG TPA: COQ9 family protein [Rhizomicrobium sp.]|jgi:ubiquinone biosynthesis protein COQ9
MAAKKKKSDEAMKAAVLAAALEHAAFDGFTDKTLAAAGESAGADKATLSRLFPKGPSSLVEAISDSMDDTMEAALTGKLAGLKIRERIRDVVLARIDALRPHKEAARRAAAFLTLPPHAALGAALLYRTVDRMWRLAGDSSTDFNFYTKRAILAGVYSSTLMRWFTDDADETATRAFLDARIANVMQFEKFKAQVKERAKGLPSLSDILGAFNRSSAR